MRTLTSFSLILPSEESLSRKDVTSINFSSISQINSLVREELEKVLDNQCVGFYYIEALGHVREVCLLSSLSYRNFLLCCKS